jgi:hypothetical protein
MITPIDRMRLPALFAPPAIALSLLLVAMGTGFAPLAPLLGVVALLVLWAAPMERTAIGFLFIALLVDNPGERPMEDKWASPLLPLGEVLYVNLHKLTGIGAFRFALIEVAIAVLLICVLYRKSHRDLIDDPRNLGALPNPVRLAFAVFFAAIIALEVYGLGRGGDFKNSLWQIRQLFWLPVLGVVFGHALKSVAARVWLLRTVVVVAVVRGVVGLFYYFTVARPSGVRPEYVTTHSDSVLTVVAMLVAGMALITRPSWGHLALNALAQPILAVSLVLNDRRIAFVSLAGGAFAMLLLAPPELKRVIRRLVVLSIPLVIVYTAVGWNSSAAVFRPVGIVRSVVEQDDTSSQTRDIENFNLIRTLAAHPVLGSGFGHEYREVVVANRVDQIFAQYRFIAHNSVLWLLSLGGWLGFAAVWLVFPVAVLVALRAFHESHEPIDRTVAYGAIASIVAFIIQAWGDMGLQSWMGTLLVAAFMGATGALWTTRERDAAEAVAC